MCDFLSAVYQRGGRLLHMVEYSDHHEDIISHHKLEDKSDVLLRNWIRVEFEPGDDITDVQSYTLNVDETSTPVWFNDDEREQCVAALSSLLRSMMVTGKVCSLVGGCWILDKANVGSIRNARIIRIQDSDVDILSNCRVRRIAGKSSVWEKIEDSNVGVISLDNGGTIVRLTRSQVGTVVGHTTIKNMYGNSVIGTVDERSSVLAMYETSSIYYLKGDARVEKMADLSSIVTVGEQAHVDYVGGYARIQEFVNNSSARAVAGYAYVHELGSFARVKHLLDYAGIGVVRNDAGVDLMTGDATIRKLCGVVGERGGDAQILNDLSGAREQRTVKIDDHVVP